MSGPRVVTNLNESVLCSARNEGERERLMWVEKLRAANNIMLVGFGKRYRSSTQRSIGIVFSRETTQNPNRWSLTLPDQELDVAVLLSGTSDDIIHDIILPVAELGENWARLNHSCGVVKFTIKKDTSGFILSILHHNRYR
jgi:hypothetical protein